MPFKNIQNQYIAELKTCDIDFVKASFSPFKDPYYFLKTLYYLVKNKSYLIITNLQNCNLVAGILRCFYFFKWINVVHNIYPEKLPFYSKIKYMLEKVLIRRSNKTMFVSNAAAQSYSAANDNKAVTLYKGISADFGYNTTAEDKTDSLCILGIGDITLNKRVDIFCEIAKNVFEELNNSKFIWIGGDKKNIDRFHIYFPYVNFVGTLKRKEILSYMGNANVILNTSFYESWSYVLIEGISFGLFPIATSGYGPEEIIRNYGVGFICTKRNEKEIIENISWYILNNKSLFAKRNIYKGREWIKELENIYINSLVGITKEIYDR